MTDEQAIKAVEDLGYTDVWILSRDDYKGILGIAPDGTLRRCAYYGIGLSLCVEIMQDKLEVA